MQIPDFYWLRQPLLSIERLLACFTEDRLADLIAEESVAQAIQVASPDVGEQLMNGFSANPKLAETALKYVLRMGTRCTPFGLFAGGSVGLPADTSAFDFSARQLIAHHRLDTQVLVDLADELARRPAIRNRIRYYANQSLYQIGNRLRYTERHRTEGEWRYFTSEVSAEPHVIAVIELARPGATIPDLVRGIAADENEAKARRFVERLIDDGVLVSELIPTPTGPEPLAHLIEKLTACSAPLPVLADLRQMQTLLSQATGTGPPIRAITTILTNQFGLSVRPGLLLQTDTRVPNSQNQLSYRVLNQLRRTLSALQGLNRLGAEADELIAFRQRFHARYEAQEIPLLLVMDDEEGIGYAGAGRLNPPDQELIADLLEPPVEKPAVPFGADKLHELMLRLYSGWSPQEGISVELTDQDLTELGGGSLPMPDSCYAFGYFLASSTSALDEGQFQFVLKALAGPSAFPMMGRFCGSDASLNQRVTTHLERQQARNPDRIFAEIAHLPQPRIGNVVQRPHLRAYEIPYLAPSALPPDRQIPLDDLLVSVPNGQRVVLRSRRLGKEVVPQLTTAHDYRSGLPLYQFLCDLQHQGTPFAVNWNWGYLAQARRLPRVQYRNIILQEASWSFTVSDLLPTLSDGQNVERLQQREQLPRFVALQQGDQELFLDLAAPMCYRLFVSTLRRVGSIRVVEWMRTPENCPVQGPGGRLTHEVVIPFFNPVESTPIPFTVTQVIANITVDSQRSFEPGSEWLYLKVYCGASAAQTILDHLVRVACQAIRAGQVTHWFFIRYQDPAPHLRVRFRLADSCQYAHLLAACSQVLSPFLSSGEVHNLQLDTYQRELERYGNETITDTERIFWRDSELVSGLLQLDLTEVSLLTAALLGIDAYQTAFGLTRPEKFALCKQIYDDLFTEHGATASLRHAIARKYRRNQALVVRLIQQQVSAEEAFLQLYIQQHHAHIQSYVNAIRHSYQADQTKQWQHLSSLAHLYLNRLFSCNQRTYELLVYHHLYRAHQSLTARSTP